MTEETSRPQRRISLDKFKAESWQGPPNINKATLYETASPSKVSLFVHT